MISKELTGLVLAVSLFSLGSVQLVKRDTITKLRACL